VSTREASSLTPVELAAIPTFWRLFGDLGG
jgi:hypothetical protein